MSRLRSTVINQISEVLSGSYFGEENFLVAYPDSGEKLCVITFAAVRDYSCTLSEKSGAQGTQLYAGCSPGQYKATDIEGVSSIREFLSVVDAWVDRIKEDLRNPVAALDAADSFREMLEESLKARNEDLQQPFSPDEIAELQAKLDQLQARITELAERQELNESELRRLKQVISGAKTDLQTFKKETWYRTTAVRVWETSKKVLTTKEGREILASGAKKLLGLE